MIHGRLLKMLRKHCIHSVTFTKTRKTFFQISLIYGMSEMASEIKFGFQSQIFWFFPTNNFKNLSHVVDRIYMNISHSNIITNILKILRNKSLCKYKISSPRKAMEKGHFLFSFCVRSHFWPGIGVCFMPLLVDPVGLHPDTGYLLTTNSTEQLTVIRTGLTISVIPRDRSRIVPSHVEPVNQWPISERNSAPSAACWIQHPCAFSAPSYTRVRKTVSQTFLTLWPKLFGSNPVIGW